MKNHWVQIELPAHGTKTGAVQINFALVQRVKPTREYGKLVEVDVRYDNEVLRFAKDSALSFMNKWEKYQELMEQDEPAQHQNIVIAENTERDLYSLNPKFR